MKTDPPRWQYQLHLERIRQAEKRLYEPPEDFCQCEIECESPQDHKQKIADFEQSVVEEKLEADRERRLL